MIRKNIPNAITCCNLICGCIAIKEVFQGNLEMASLLIGAALVFDFFDGFAARLLKVTSSIGKDLDSLADAVTFGVTPSFIVYVLIKNAVNSGFYGQSAILEYLPYSGFLIALFSVIRLAKFNNDPRQSHSFFGLPTPANAILFASLPLILASNAGLSFQHGTIMIENPAGTFLEDGTLAAFVMNPWFLSLLSLIQSLLLVSEIPLMALKFKNFNWKENVKRYLLIVSVPVFLLFMGFLGIPCIILFYILLSLTERKSHSDIKQD